MMKKLYAVLVALFFLSCTDDAENPEVQYKKVIDTNGGSLVSADNRLSLSIPENALQRSTEIIIKPSASHPPGALGPVYDLLPDGTNFTTPATLLFSYSEDWLEEGTSEADLSLAYAENGSWIPVPSVVDQANNKIQAQIEHFTPYAIIYSNTRYQALCGLLALYKVPTVTSDHQLSQRAYEFEYDDTGRLIKIESLEPSSSNYREWVLNYNSESLLSDMKMIEKEDYYASIVSETTNYDFSWIRHTNGAFAVMEVLESKETAGTTKLYKLSTSLDDAGKPYYDMLEVYHNNTPQYWVHLPRNSSGYIAEVSYTDSIVSYRYDTRMNALWQTNTDPAVHFMIFKDAVKSFSKHNITHISKVYAGGEKEKSFNYTYNDRGLPTHAEATDSRLPAVTLYYELLYHHYPVCE